VARYSSSSRTGSRKVLATTLAVGSLGGAVSYGVIDPAHRTTLEDIIPALGTGVGLDSPQKSSSSDSLGEQIISSLIGFVPAVSAEESEEALEVLADTQEDISVASQTKNAESDKSVITEAEDSVEKAAESEEAKTGEEAVKTEKTDNFTEEDTTTSAEDLTPKIETPETNVEPASIAETEPVVDQETAEHVTEEDRSTIEANNEQCATENGQTTTILETDEQTIKNDAEKIQEEPTAQEENSSGALTTETPAEEAVDQNEKSDIITSVNEESISAEPGLSELCQMMEDAVRAAVTEFDGYSAEVVNHINLMLKVMELNLAVKDEDAWNEMFLAAQSKSEKAKSVELKEREALIAITKVMDNIANWRKDCINSDNQELDLAEENANVMIYQIDQAKAKVEAVQTEALAMEKFHDLVEAGKEEFHKEMASIMPDVELGQKSGKLSEYELNMFITHAYKKVLFLQQEVAKQQTLEQAKLSKALESQKKEAEAIAMKHKEEELEKQAKEMKEEQDKKISKIRKEAEEQLSSHLKRQAAAHTEHVNDTLTTQKEEMKRKHDHQMEEQAAKMKKAHTDTLNTLSGSLSGLTTALEARSSSDTASLAAQSLWLASNTLKNSLNLGNLEAASWEEKLKPLIEDVGQVKSIAGPGDEFIEVILGSISPVALERGVFTEDSLKEKFCKVEKVAKQVAGIGDEGGSLLAFGLSYLQSLLMVNLAQRTPTETLEKVDLSVISATDLINLAKHKLDRGNLAQAVQLMGQLKGEPGRVATDWLTEARLTLETQQAVEALIMYSQANSCRFLPAI